MDNQFEHGVIRRSKSWHSGFNLSGESSFLSAHLIFASVQLGIGLVDAGYAVTLFSEHTPEAVLNSRPMGTPILHPDALQLERKLRLNFWFEAYPGGSMDRFFPVQSGQQLLELSKKVIQQLTPWNYEFVKDMELTDEMAWLCGAITPTVRQPIGRLPLGATVMGIGDTVILNDPIAGQGANNATKMAHLVTQRIIEHGNRRFDESWMQAVFDEFWEYSQYVNALSNCLLTPPAHLQDIVVAMTSYPEVARDYFNGFNNPPSLFPWFFEPEETKKYLAQKNGRGMVSNA